jgi:hypothetical protein
MGDGQIFLKTSAISLTNTYQMNILSARSISLDSTFIYGHIFVPIKQCILIFLLLLLILFIFFVLLPPISPPLRRQIRLKAIKPEKDLQTLSKKARLKYLPPKRRNLFSLNINSTGTAFTDSLLVF